MQVIFPIRISKNSQNVRQKTYFKPIKYHYELQTTNHFQYLFEVVYVTFCQCPVAVAHVLKISDHFIACHFVK